MIKNTLTLLIPAQNKGETDRYIELDFFFVETQNQFSIQFYTPHSFLKFPSTSVCLERSKNNHDGIQLTALEQQRGHGTFGRSIDQVRIIM